MLSVANIKQVLTDFITGTEMFLVDVSISPNNEVEITVDSPTGLSLDHCAAINRAIEAAFDREEEDYALTVGSPGLGAPLKVLPQYQKLIGKTVEVLLMNGEKLLATLIDATEDNMQIRYTKKELVEGAKRKQNVTHTARLDYKDIKWTRAFIKV
ncbi:MAG: ribosome assembly cofactor RimP [Bacteroidales bacterium]